MIRPSSASVVSSYPVCIRCNEYPLGDDRDLFADRESPNYQLYCPSCELFFDVPERFRNRMSTLCRNPSEDENEGSECSFDDDYQTAASDFDDVGNISELNVISRSTSAASCFSYAESWVSSPNTSRVDLPELEDSDEESDCSSRETGGKRCSGYSYFKSDAHWDLPSFIQRHSGSSFGTDLNQEENFINIKEEEDLSFSSLPTRSLPSSTTALGESKPKVSREKWKERRESLRLMISPRSEFTDTAPVSPTSPLYSLHCGTVQGQKWF